MGLKLKEKTNTLYTVRYDRLNNVGIPGTVGLKNRNGSVYFKSIEDAKKRINDINDRYIRNGMNYHMIKNYVINEIRKA